METVGSLVEQPAVDQPGLGQAVEPLADAGGQLGGGLAGEGQAEHAARA